MVTGYLPQEILGTNIYDYIHTEDVNVFMTTHQSMLQYPNNTVISNVSQIYKQKLLAIIMSLRTN